MGSGTRHGRKKDSNYRHMKENVSQPALQQIKIQSLLLKQLKHLYLNRYTILKHSFVEPTLYPFIVTVEQQSSCNVLLIKASSFKVVN